MSENASRVYYKILSVINKDATSTAQYWPMVDGFSPDLAISIIDVYKELVSNQGYALPENPEAIKKLTAEIRKKLNLNSAKPALYLAPTNVIMRMNESLSSSEGNLYKWAFPGRLQTTPEEKQELEKSKEITERVSEGLKDVKWIVVAGLVGFVLVQTGILKKLAPA